MKLGDLGREMEYSTVPFSLVPLIMVPTKVNNRPTMIPFEVAVLNLAQWSGGEPSIEEGDPIPVQYYSFQALPENYSTPTKPDLAYEERRKLDLDEDDEDSESEDEWDGDLDDSSELFETEDELLASDASELPLDFVKQLHVHRILPQMLIAAVYGYFGDYRIQVGFLATSLETGPWEGNLVVFDGCYLMAYHQATSLIERSPRDLCAHSQQFTTELLRFLEMASIVPTLDKRSAIQHIAINVASPRIENNDISLPIPRNFHDFWGD